LFRDYIPSYVLRLNINDCFSFFKTNKYNEEEFNYYLTGLIEGSGTIIVPKNMDRGNIPSIRIKFNRKNFALLMLIQAKLNSGEIKRFKGDRSYYLIFNVKKDLLDLTVRIGNKVKLNSKHYYLKNMIYYFIYKKKELKYYTNELCDILKSSISHLYCTLESKARLIPLNSPSLLDSLPLSYTFDRFNRDIHTESNT
jgi:hypothetical protein